MPTIERQGRQGVPMVRRYPEVRGGICEFCGVINPSKPSTEQYKLCPHFKDIGELRCSYCDATKNPEEVIYKSVMNTYEHPDNPAKLVVVCDNFTCIQKHQERFQTAK